MGVLASRLGKSADDIAEVVAHERHVNDTNRVEDAFNKLRNAQVDLTLGSDGFSKLHGGDAVNTPILSQWGARFDDQVKRLSEGLSSDEQRTRFMQRAGAAKAGFTGDIYQHVAKENDAYSKDVFRATLDTELRAVGAAPQDETSFGLAVTRLSSAFDQEARRTGVSSVTVGRTMQSKAAVIDSLWVSRLEAWRVQDPVGALTAFHENAGQLSPAVRQKLAEGLYRDAAPVLASTIRQQPLDTVANTQEEARAIAEHANRAGIQVNVRVNERGFDSNFNTALTPKEEQDFQAWKKQYAPNDSGADYDLRGAFKAGLKPGPDAHWSDEFKKPNHPTFSNQSMYSEFGNPGTWAGEWDAKTRTYTPPQGEDVYTPGRGQKRVPAPAQDETVFDRLPVDQKLHILDMAYTQGSQDRALTRANLQSRVQDATAALERGLAPTDVPSRDELVFSLGQEHGGRVERSLAEAKAFGDDYIRIAGSSRTEQAQMLASRQPLPGVGFAEAQHRQEQLAGAIDRVRKEQDQDPATFVLQNSPLKNKSLRDINGGTDVRTAYEAFQGALADQKATPEAKAAAAQAYALASLAEQKRLEIQSPQILPKSMVDAIAKRFAEPPAQGESMGSVMRGMVDQWGRYWPMVGAQLKGKIPPEAEVIGLGITPEAEAVLSEAMKLKPEALRQGIDPATSRDIKDRVTQAMEPLQRSVAWQSGGLATYDNYADSAEKIATALVQKGMKPKDAATKAFEGVAGFKYEFEDTWRVPKSVLGGEVNTSMLRHGAEALKRDIAADKPVLGEKVALQVPMAPGGVRPEDADRQWRDTVKANGFWVTSPGDGGLTLYVKSGLGAQPVLDAQGMPLRRSWSEISGVGRAVRAATFADVKRKP